MNREQIKLTAIAAMTINYTAIALVPPQSVMYFTMTDIGYLTAVTMCYFPCRRVLPYPYAVYAFSLLCSCLGD